MISWLVEARRRSRLVGTATSDGTALTSLAPTSRLTGRDLTTVNGVWQVYIVKSLQR
jgi:hypothetical protein